MEEPLVSWNQFQHIHERPTRFLRILYKQNQSGQAEPVCTERGRMKEGFPQAENRLTTLRSSKYMLPFMKKMTTPEMEAQAQRVEPETTLDFSKALEHNVTCPPGFKIAWDW